MTRFAPPVSSLIVSVALGLAFACGVPGAPRAEETQHKSIVVPPGNRSPVQPEISSSSIKRTAETKGTFES
jgi:hypothetical protein